jgi:hypothetical protein
MTEKDYNYFRDEKLCQKCSLFVLNTPPITPSEAGLVISTSDTLKNNPASALGLMALSFGGVGRRTCSRGGIAASSDMYQRPEEFQPNS